MWVVSADVYLQDAAGVPDTRHEKVSFPCATSPDPPGLAIPFLDSVLSSPLPRSRFVPRTIGLVNVGNLGHQRIVGVGVCEHRAD